MNLFNEIEKIYDEIKSEYDKDKFKLTDENYKSYFNGMKNLLKRRTEKYEIVAKELEIQLLSDKNIKKSFKKTYKRLDTLLRNTTIDIKVFMPRKEKKFKIGLINGVRKEHKLYVDCFKRFENEVNI